MCFFFFPSTALFPQYGVPGESSAAVGRWESLT